MDDNLWDYQFQALEIIPFTASDWYMCCIHPLWNVSNVNFLVFPLSKYNQSSAVCANLYDTSSVYLNWHMSVTQWSPAVRPGRMEL